MQKALPDFAGAETRVRQLIANGNSKLAVDSAKELHKVLATAASEELLLDAYEARIRALTAQNLSFEATALRDLVVQRYPAAADRLSGKPKPQQLDDLVRPLTDPGLTPERRAEIENRVMREVHDLEALAECGALPAEHPLRQTAGRLHSALLAVTQRPVGAEEVELPDVSHRGPLAGWKLMVRAIACFYRREDESCLKYLDAVRPAAAAARAIPALRAMLGAKGLHLTAAASELVGAVSPNPAALRQSLEQLDQAFGTRKQGPIAKAITAAVAACRAAAPDRVERLKQHIAARSVATDLTPKRITEAMGGASRHDAYSLRLFARVNEEMGEPVNLVTACQAWEQFRVLAVEEKWFAANSKEAAALYIHMAGVLRRMGPETIEDLHRHGIGWEKKVQDEQWYLFPERLYGRACALDPHKEVFAEWMEWERVQRGGNAEDVADAWHKVLPQDIEPLLYLIEQKSARNAFHSSLQYLAKAEAIDSVHPMVRRWRLRLLVGSVVRHLQQKKPHLAEEKLDQMEKLPQTQQGDRLAFVAAARFIISAVTDRQDATARRDELTRAAGGRPMAVLLLASIVHNAKMRLRQDVPTPERLEESERATLAETVIRGVGLSRDLDLNQPVPVEWLAYILKRFAKIQQSLDVRQLGVLGETALRLEQVELAYAVSAAGLERGGGSEVNFLLLRAQCLHHCELSRWPVCAAAAAQLARERRQMDIVERAVRLLADEEYDDLSVTAVQAQDVLKKEKAAQKLPSAWQPGPNYRDLMGDSRPCTCPACRAKRGETGNPYKFDEDELDDVLDFPVPPDMPPQIAAMLKSELRKALERGEPMDSVMNRLLNMLPNIEGPQRKGRRR